MKITLKIADFEGKTQIYDTTVANIDIAELYFDASLFTSDLILEDGDSFQHNK